jgi:hypothetical protein
MSRRFALVFAVLLAVDAVIGAVALTRTLDLGQASQKASRKATTALIAKRTTQLDRFEASLRAQLVRKPPPLPSVPSGATSPAPPPPTAVASATPQVRYVRPAPIVVHKHRPGGELEAADSGGGGGGGDG